jgi:putative transposase
LSHLLGKINIVPTLEARYRFRLRVSNGQARELQQVFDSCRFVWNQALGRWDDLWQYERTSLPEKTMHAELTDWRSRFEWLADVPVTPQQQIIIDLSRSVRAFFDKTNPAGRPRFKKRGACSSARWTVRGFSIKNDRLSVAVAGGRIDLRVVWSRSLPSMPKSVTVYRDAAGHWWASFVVRIEAGETPSTGIATGLDVGLTTFATTEFADADIPNPRYARRAAKALARSQRNTARKQKGSSTRAKAKRTTAKVHDKVVNQRKDFAHKEARTLARRFDRIGVEDLKIKNMSRRGKGRSKSGLNRAIHDAGWGQFLRALEWHARKSGHEVVRINPRNTTQTCSDCGVKAKQRIGLADRIFNCDCGLVLDRDRNAARNLNPNRLGNTGVGIDGSKTKVPAGTAAA